MKLRVLLLLGLLTFGKVTSACPSVTVTRLSLGDAFEAVKGKQVLTKTQIDDFLAAGENMDEAALGLMRAEDLTSHSCCWSLTNSMWPSYK